MPIWVVFEWSRFLQPFDVFSILPFSVTLLIVWEKGSLSMLFSVFPHAVVNSSIIPPENAASFPLIIDKGALIPLAIGPNHDSLTVHFILWPLSFIGFSVGPNIFAKSRNLTIFKWSRIGTSIWECQITIAVFLAVNVTTLVFGTIRPRLYAMTMLFIIFPHSFVFSTIEMSVLTIALSLIVDPLANIIIAICMNQATIAVGLIVDPPALIHWAVLPRLFTFAVPYVLIFYYLSFICCSIQQNRLIIQNDFVAKIRSKAIIKVS